jgi:hypothetical protein
MSKSEVFESEDFLEKSPEKRIPSRIEIRKLLKLKEEKNQNT